MAMEESKTYVETNITKPGRYGNRVNAAVRGTAYGEQCVVPSGKEAYGTADEGSYFIARNPTIGTGIVGIAAAATAADTETLLYIRNAASDTDQTRIYLDYLRLVVTAAGASGTTTQFYSWIDAGDRYSSGGSSITAVNANMDSSTSSAATIKFGAVVTTAASSAKRTVGGGSLRLGVIKVVGDVYVIDFGGYTQDMPTVVTSGTAQCLVPWRHCPVVLGPGDGFGIEVFAASQAVTPAAFEFELGYYER